MMSYEKLIIGCGRYSTLQDNPFILMDFTPRVEVTDDFREYIVVLSKDSFINTDKTIESLITLEKKKQMFPKFLLCISSKRNLRDKLLQKYNSQSPLIFAEEERKFFSLFCPRSRTEWKFMWSVKNSLFWKNLINICADKKVLKVGYNNLMPYFAYFDIHENSVDGMFFKSFIERKNITVEWHNANSSWGPYDEKTGKFGGLVGMVTYQNLLLTILTGIT